MAGKNYYDVTDWHVGNPYTDIGEVINSILADIKGRQQETDVNDEGKPGAVIYIPSGDYHLKTQVKIDISYLKIQGSGHGFVSSSIRYNVPREQWKDLHDIWPGGSRILVDLKPEKNDERSGAAFLVEREGDPRISSVEFENFCIDGLHFVDAGNGDPENTYVNGKTGNYVASAQDSFRITGMGIIYLEHGVTLYNSDALSVHDNFIAECGNCVELRGAGQASKITDNLMGAGYRGHSIYAENFGGLLVASNNIFPRGRSIVHFRGVLRSSVTANRFHSFYPGMLIFEDCRENLISSNHFLRDHEPWPPMQGYDNGLNDDYGLIHIEGSCNSVISNHISETIEMQYLKPAGIKPVVIRLVSGTENYVACNHIVATTQADKKEKEGDSSCFDAQVGALLSMNELVRLSVDAVRVDAASSDNVILDTCRESEAALDFDANVFRGIPGK